MVGSPDAPAQPGGEARRGGPSPLERIASFRFAYLAIFVFLLAYVFTVEGLQELLRRHYKAAVEAAVRVDPADGPVAQQIADRLGALMRSSPWIRYGDVRVRPLVLGADGRTLLFAAGGYAPAGDVAHARRAAARDRGRRGLRAPQHGARERGGCGT